MIFVSGMAVALMTEVAPGRPRQRVAAVVHALTRFAAVGHQFKKGKKKRKHPPAAESSTLIN